MCARERPSCPPDVEERQRRQCRRRLALSDRFDPELADGQPLLNQKRSVAFGGCWHELLLRQEDAESLEAPPLRGGVAFAHGVRVPVEALLIGETRDAIEEARGAPRLRDAADDVRGEYKSHTRILSEVNGLAARGLQDGAGVFGCSDRVVEGGRRRVEAVGGDACDLAVVTRASVGLVDGDRVAAVVAIGCLDHQAEPTSCLACRHQAILPVSRKVPVK